MPEKLSPGAVGSLIGVSRPTVYKYLRNGVFSTATYEQDIGYRVDPDEIDQIIGHPGASAMLSIVAQAITDALEFVSGGESYSALKLAYFNHALKIIKKLKRDRSNWRDDTTELKRIIGEHVETWVDLPHALGLVEVLGQMPPPRPYREPAPRMVTLAYDELLQYMTEEQLEFLRKRKKPAETRRRHSVPMTRRGQ